MLPLLLALALQQPGAPAAPGRPLPPAAPPTTIAIDERLAADAGLRVGSRVVLSAAPGARGGDAAVVAAIVRRGADPADVARREYRVRMHLPALQRLVGYGDRVDRFAAATPGGAAAEAALDRINASAFGFRAYRSRDIAVETSRTFQVVSRFHRAIGVITIVASAIFLLCILLLKVEERRRDVAALRLMGVSRVTVVKTLVLEAALVALTGAALGTGIGWVASQAINYHYRGVYRTPLTFALVTPEIALLAAALSVALGIGAGVIAAVRLARTPPLVLFGR